MDFKRVEGIFLVVFLFLNMFLFYVYQEGKTEQKIVTTGAISDNIEERLRSDEINIPHSLSEKVQQGYYLSAEESEFLPDIKEILKGQEWQVNGSQLIGNMTFSPDVILSDGDEAQQIKKFINTDGTVFNGNEYVWNENETQVGSHYVFNQEFEGISFFDETSELTVNLTKDNLDSLSIDQYEQTYLSNIEALRDPQNLISEREAVISLYTNNKLQSGNKIKWIELGYTWIFTVREKNVYIPAWFIAVEGNKNNVQIERVNAFSNAILSSNISEVKN